MLITHREEMLRGVDRVVEVVGGEVTWGRRAEEVGARRGCSRSTGADRLCTFSG